MNRLIEFFCVMLLLIAGCSDSDSNSTSPVNPGETPVAGDGIQIIFLHHSTGENIWNGGVSGWFDQYNADHATSYRISERAFPQDAYGWKNYPYDYWNIWVNHGDSTGEPTLETLTQQYQVIIWKHCFPVSEIEEDIGSPDVTSEDKRLENYYLQYAALKAKMREFPNTTFIVWTGAAQVKDSINAESAARARVFFNWVKSQWDEPGDNIFLWDFYELETEGGIYLRGDYAASSDDSHPNEAFSQRVAPLFSQRTVNVIEGRGDSSSITGE